MEKLRKELLVRVVYAGAALGGKSCNIKLLRAGTHPENRGSFGVREREEGHYLHFDFSPSSLPHVNGLPVRIVLQTPGGSLHLPNLERHLLRDADAVIFVADSQRERRCANKYALQDVVDYLEGLGKTRDDLVFAIQYNKRDLPNAMSLDELRADLNPEGRYLDFEACAALSDGPGVFETLKAVVKRVFLDYLADARANKRSS